MIARDWQIAIALTPIVIIELETCSNFFWLHGQVDGIEFKAQLPADGTAVLLQRPGILNASWDVVRGSTGGAPLMSLELLVTSVRRQRA